MSLSVATQPTHCILFLIFISLSLHPPLILLVENTQQQKPKRWTKNKQIGLFLFLFFSFLLWYSESSRKHKRRNFLNEINKERKRSSHISKKKKNFFRFLFPRGIWHLHIYIVSLWFTHSASSYAHLLNIYLYISKCTSYCIFLTCSNCQSIIAYINIKKKCCCCIVVIFNIFVLVFIELSTPPFPVLFVFWSFHIYFASHSHQLHSFFPNIFFFFVLFCFHFPVRYYALI